MKQNRCFWHIRESDPRMVVVYLIVFLMLCLLTLVLATAPGVLVGG